MAAGPISERNQGDWGERARNGLRGREAGPWPPVLTSGPDTGLPRGRETGPVPAGGGAGAGFGPRPVGAMLSVPNLLPSRWQESCKENLQQNSKLGVRRFCCSCGKGGVWASSNGFFCCFLFAPIPRLHPHLPRLVFTFMCLSSPFLPIPLGPNPLLPSSRCHRVRGGPGREG